VPVRAIADRAGLGVSTLYRHFPDKEALIDGVSRHRWSTMRDLAAAPVPAPDAALGRIVLLADTFSRMVTADAEFIESAGLRVGQAPMSALVPAKFEFDRSFARLWGRALREGHVRAHSDPRDLVELTGALRDAGRRAAQVRLLLHGISQDDEVVDRLLAGVLRYPDPAYL
jgi:AcrR family transcriptional regulator